MKRLRSAAFMVAAFITITMSCRPSFKKDVETGVNEEKYWQLHHATWSGDSVILQNAGSSMVSAFSMKNFRFTVYLTTTGNAEGSLDFHASSDTTQTGKGYSVKICNTAYRSGSAQKTGSLLHIRNNYVNMVPDSSRFRLTLDVSGNKITVAVNDNIISEYIEPENPVRIDALKEMKLSSGSFRISKTNAEGTIVIGKMLIEARDNDMPIAKDTLFVSDSTGEMLNMLNQQDFPVIDFHGHLKGGLTVDEVSAHGRLYGYNYGIAPNCGLNFPVTNDSSLNAWYREMKQAPVFKAMQCEGREWVTLFSPAAISQYDYIFTDAMTWTDHKGRRMRLWIPEETFVDNDQQFMDMLVKKIESELSQEPVDIFVNPTYLPEVLASRYNELWTPERMDRVIKVLVENDVALEINSRFRIPSPDFVKRAKAAGVKFTLGTNNAGHDDLGRLEYSLWVIREAGITAGDMFLPRPAGDKKVMTKGLPAKITG